MRAFLAIIKLTFHNTLRSHIFQLLLGLLTLCVVAIPFTTSGDGSASGFIQVSLLYSLSGVVAILSLSSVWVSCYIMTQDIESYQIHMMISKPVSRVKIWLAKFTGIVIMHAVLLLISSIIIYFIIMGQFARTDFTKNDKAKVESEVLVGRRVFRFAPPNLEERAQQMLFERMQKVAQTGERLEITSENEKFMLDEMKKMAIADNSQVAPEAFREWTFENLPVDTDQPLFLRYRTYVGKVSSKDQRMTSGQWLVAAPQFQRDAQGQIIDETQYQFQYFAYPQESMRSGEFYEKVIPPAMLKPIAPDGKAKIGYYNFDPEKQTQYFQPSDGPVLLIKVTGFFENYLRAVMVIMLELIILVGLGCAFSSCFTMPTAIFLSITYLFGGSFASYLTENSVSEDFIVRALSTIMLWIIIPLQEFGVTDMVAKGELIEWSLMGSLFLKYFVFKALPIILLGVFLYKRREVGLVVRK